ncbi:hypothetical protein RJ639_003063 [Escallonia herrerae]|uniref:DUF659 domain-containing protein n=1 Tax=Escallonia herrerae TaxID=1293975 RepID=A0AA88WC78_9ASTE|nr:hypothetical protein RJ639_003063 [Escallonia herrerae]
MTDNSSSIVSALARSDDPAWAHGKVVAGKRNNTICIRCDKHLKMHLVGFTGQVEACIKAPHDVRWQMKQLLKGNQKEKARKEKLNVDIGFDDDSEYIAVSAESIGNARKNKGKEVVVANKRKKLHIGGTMLINVPFNAAHSKYYQPMFDTVLAVGSGFKAPSFHDLRGNLLRTLVDEITVYLDNFRPIWELYGCSVMSDGWSNHRQEPVINFLKGAMLLKSIDASSLTKDADMLYTIFDQVVQLIGPNYIVQFITDNEAAYKAAGKRLKMEYGFF